jgi:hypothetical protein
MQGLYDVIIQNNLVCRSFIEGLLIVYFARVTHLQFVECMQIIVVYMEMHKPTIHIRDDNL